MEATSDDAPWLPSFELHMTGSPKTVPRNGLDPVQVVAIIQDLFVVTI
jgi:hypothetical protein